MRINGQCPIERSNRARRKRMPLLCPLDLVRCVIGRTQTLRGRRHFAAVVRQAEIEARRLFLPEGSPLSSQ